MEVFINILQIFSFLLSLALFVCGIVALMLVSEFSRFEKKKNKGKSKK